MRTFLAIAICFLTAEAFAQSPYHPQIQPKPSEYPTAQDKRGTPESPLVIKGVVTTKADEKTAAEREEEKEKQVTDTWVMRFTGLAAGFTFLLVIVTGILATYTYRLWRSTANLVRGSEKTAERQLRAYIGAYQYAIAIFKDGQPDFIQVHMTNYGQTPAHKTTIVAAIDIFPWPLPEHHQLPPLPSPGAASVLFPTAQLDSPARAIRTFSDEELSAAVNGQSVRLYVFGVVKYIDAFNEPRETHFCSSISGGPELLKVKNGESGSLRFEIANQHNNAT